MDFRHWLDKLEPEQTPLLTMLKKGGPIYSESAAITGYDEPSHPRLAHALAYPQRFLSRLSRAAIAIAGYRESEDEYGNFILVPSETGIEGLKNRLYAHQRRWSQCKPIYDQDKLQEIRARQPVKITWGLATPPVAPEP